MTYRPPPPPPPAADLTAAVRPAAAGVQYGTEHDAAAVLGLSAATLRTWRSRRLGPPCWRRFGRSVRYDLNELRVWAAVQRPRAGGDGT